MITIFSKIFTHRIFIFILILENFKTSSLTCEYFDDSMKISEKEIETFLSNIRYERKLKTQKVRTALRKNRLNYSELQAQALAAKIPIIDIKSKSQKKKLKANQRPKAGKISIKSFVNKKHVRQFKKRCSSKTQRYDNFQSCYSVYCDQENLSNKKLNLRNVNYKIFKICDLWKKGHSRCDPNIGSKIYPKSYYKGLEKSKVEGHEQINLARQSFKFVPTGQVWASESSIKYPSKRKACPIPDDFIEAKLHTLAGKDIVEDDTVIYYYDSFPTDPKAEEEMTNLYPRSILEIEAKSSGTDRATYAWSLHEVKVTTDTQIVSHKMAKDLCKLLHPESTPFEIRNEQELQYISNFKNFTKEYYWLNSIPTKDRDSTSYKYPSGVKILLNMLSPEFDPDNVALVDPDHDYMYYDKIFKSYANNCLLFRSNKYENKNLLDRRRYSKVSNDDMILGQKNKAWDSMCDGGEKQQGQVGILCEIRCENYFE